MLDLVLMFNSILPMFPFISMVFNILQKTGYDLEQFRNKSLFAFYCSSLRTCISYLVFSMLFISAEDPCSELSLGPGSKYSPMKSTYKSGTTVTVSCERGYRLMNWDSLGNTFTCKNGTWTPFVRPTCSGKYYSSSVFTGVSEPKLFLNSLAINISELTVSRQHCS